PGDVVRRDEPIYVMETDKAITEVESPFSGTLVEWVVEPDSILPIGTEIARMQVAGEEAPTGPGHGVPDASISTSGGASHSESSPDGGRRASGDRNGPIVRAVPAVALTLAGNLNVPIPPRTRKYLREKGLLPKAHEIPAQGKKLLPDDVDRYVLVMAASTEGGWSADPTTSAVQDRLAPALEGTGLLGTGYTETALPKSQQTLNYRMQRGADACIPAVLEIDLEWRNIAAARERTRHTTGETGFSMLVWCVVQAMRNHARLRSSISSDGKMLRTYPHVNIGVAVAVEDGLLRTAVVREADRLNRSSFASSLRAQVDRVRGGEDQIDASTTVTVSNVGIGGVRMGIPVIVTPAVATMALGQIRMSPFPLEVSGFQFRPVATLTITFDHR
ncbi:MAG TPA: 2-oxo acid dehydrogenase subunit E2, partial [Pirellulaceae bacterium]